jgi:hypothetical protein
MDGISLLEGPHLHRILSGVEASREAASRDFRRRLEAMSPHGPNEKGKFVKDRLKGLSQYEIGPNLYFSNQQSCHVRSSYAPCCCSASHAFQDHCSGLLLTACDFAMDREVAVYCRCVRLLQESVAAWC